MRTRTDNSSARAEPPGDVIENRFRGLVEASLQGILVHRNFVPVFSNQAFATMLGYEAPDEVLALGTLERIFAPEEISRLRSYAEMRPAEDSSVPSVYEVVAMRRDASRAVLQNGATMVDWDGGPAILCTAIDLTESKNFESRLVESEQLLRTVVSNSPVILWSINREGTIQLADGKGLEAQGLTPDKVLGQSIYDIYKDHPDFLANVRRALAGEAFNAINETKGAYYDRWFEPMFDEQGGVTGVIGVSVDITERGLAERAIQESQRLLRSVIDALPHLIFYKDTELRYQMVNRAFAEFHGSTIEDMVGRRSRDLRRRTEENRTAFADEDTSVLDRGELVYNADIRVQAPDGTVVVYDSVKIPLRDGSGRITGIVGIAKDVTELRRYQLELEGYQQHLEELVEKRTTELMTAQRELVTQERLATIGHLTATVSHELRNPLGTIQATHQVLRRLLDPGNDTITANMDRLDRNILRCVKIIDELLDYTRNRQLQQTTTEVDRWLREDVAKDLLIPDAISLELDLRSAMRVAIDPDRLRQAVVNLVHNACQSMQEADVRQGVVELRSVVSDGRLEIQVTDSGPGVAEESLERMFEPLFSTRAFGVGLGLPLVRQIAEQHGGGIDYQTSPGGGAAFTLWVPLQ